MLLRKCLSGEWKYSSHRSGEKTSDRAMSHTSKERNSDGEGQMLWNYTRFREGQGLTGRVPAGAGDPVTAARPGRSVRTHHQGDVALSSVRKKKKIPGIYHIFNLISALF